MLCIDEEKNATLLSSIVPQPQCIHVIVEGTLTLTCTLHGVLDGEVGPLQVDVCAGLVSQQGQVGLPSLIRSFHLYFKYFLYRYNSFYYSPKLPRLTVHVPGNALSWPVLAPAGQHTAHALVVIY